LKRAGTDCGGAAVGIVTVGVPLLAKDPNVAPIVPALKPRFAVPTGPFPKVTAPATAPLKSTVKVAPLLTTMLGAQLLKVTSNSKRVCT
jgi:hypothetical protein